jgi:hypothetical protein
MSALSNGAISAAWLVGGSNRVAGKRRRALALRRPAVYPPPQTTRVAHIGATPKSSVMLGVVILGRF